jgi:hypothetical protein
MSWGSAIRTRISRLQGPAGCRYPIPHRSLLPDPNRDLPRTGRLRFRLRQGGESRAPRPTAGGAVRMAPGSYARGESDPHQPGSRPGRSTSCGTSAWSRHPVPTRISRLTRARPQPCATASLAILVSNQETPGSGPGGSANSPNGHQCGRCDSNAQAARFGLARSPGCRHSRICAPPGT